MSDIAPCPWCEDGGRPFPHLSRDPFMSYTVRCYTCFAAGPHVTFQPTQKKPWAETIKEPMAKSIERWNDRSNMMRGDEGEESSENRADNETAEPALEAVS